MPSTGPQHVSASIPAGRAKSCTECRQVKVQRALEPHSHANQENDLSPQLACDAKKTFPAACARCVTKRLNCKLDSSFKRVPTRKRIEDFTNELNNLRAKVDASHSPPTSSSLGIAGDAKPSMSKTSPAKVPQIELGEAETAATPWLNIDHSQETQSRSLELITLQPETILELLSHFDRYYLPHLPILEPVESTSALIEKSPLLFWTIILTSCQWHPSLSYLYQQMVAPQQTLLTSLLHHAIDSIYAVHALLIAAIWPVPRVTQSQDPAWNYSCLAISGAIQMGLRRPLATPDPFEDWGGWNRGKLSKFSVKTKVLTWLACFNVNVPISTFVGVPPQLCTPSQLDEISQTCRDAEAILPRSFLAYTEIQRQIGRYTAQLDGIVDNHAQQSLVSFLGRELESIKTSYYDAWSPELEVHLEAAKLNLYALCFVNEQRLAPQSSAARSQASAYSQLIWQQGLMAASRLVSTFADIHANTANLPDSITYSTLTGSSSSHLLFYPKPYFTSLYFATVYLLRYLVAQPHASQQDREQAINHISTSHKIFSGIGCSRDHKRAGLLIEVLGRMTRSGGLAPNFYIKSRLGASFVYDSTVNAGLYRNRDPQTGQLARLHTWLTFNESANLPPAPEELADYTAALSTNSRSGSNPDESPLLENYMQMDEGWTWGMWDDQIFDSLGMGAGFQISPDGQY